MENPSVISKKDRFTQILSVRLRENNKKKYLKQSQSYKTLIWFSVEPEFNFITENFWQPPNDTRYVEQWGFGASPGIRVQEAWSITTGDVTPRVRVGVFETNLQANHPDSGISEICGGLNVNFLF